LARAKAINVEAAKRILIWSWDHGYASKFLDIYWSDKKKKPSPRSGSLLRWGANNGAMVLGVAVEEDSAKSSSLASNLKSFLVKQSTLFLLLDPHQVGSTEKQLEERSILKKYLPTVGPVIIVAQGMRSLFHSPEALVEGVWGLQRMSKNLNMEVVAFLANDDAAALSVLMDELWFEGDTIKTHQDEERMLASLQKSRWFHPPVEAADVIRHWRIISQKGEEK
jgi:hypothetical protein